MFISSADWDLQYYTGSWTSFTLPTARGKLNWSMPSSVEKFDSRGEIIISDTGGIKFMWGVQFIIKNDTDFGNLMTINNEIVVPDTTNDFFRLYPDTVNKAALYYEVNGDVSNITTEKDTHEIFFLELWTKDKYTNFNTSTYVLS